jgi:hypothetical protein
VRVSGIFRGPAGLVLKRQEQVITPRAVMLVRGSPPLAALAAGW